MFSRSSYPRRLYLVLNQYQLKLFERGLEREIHEGDMVLGAKVIFNRYIDSDELVGADWRRPASEDHQDNITADG
jgi:hypothetical protein